MKAKLLVLACMAIIVIVNVFNLTTGCTSKPTTTDTETDSITNSFAQIPIDFSVKEGQAGADLFSWQTFIALNWPANVSNCGADTTNGSSILSGKGPVVWETYLTAEQVYVAAGSQPDAWCANGVSATSFSKLPQKVQDLANKTGVYRFLRRSSKFPHGFDQASGQPLVDQNGRFVRYEVRINPDEYNYLIADTLWSAAGQKNFIANSKTVSFPVGATKYGQVGAMEIKAAWKVLGKGDDPSRFYTIKAIVYNDDSEQDPSPGENPVTLGLVGLHIAHKTPTQADWVWSTFEQVDNLTKSFYNPNCNNCPVNVPLPASDSLELSPDGKPLNAPTQVTRINPIQDSAAVALNNRFQTLLKGSVWSNYQLVSTQWLLFDDVAPGFLANSVLETFLQGPNPPSYGNFKINAGQSYFTSPDYHPFAPGISSSCMGCHYVANLPGTNAKADFSFLMGEAK